MKVNKWLDIWLNKYVKHTIKPKTYNIYKEIIRLHINPLLSDYKLSFINSNILQSYINKKVEHGNILNNKPLSINTIMLIKSILRQSFSFALKLNLIKQNPLLFVLFP